MPCKRADHSHEWPTEGTLTIERCEVFCAFCEGEDAEFKWKYAWFLRRHVRHFHLGNGQYPNLQLTDGWSRAPAGYAKKDRPRKRAPPKRGRKKQDETPTPTPDGSDASASATPEPALPAHSISAPAPPVSARVASAVPAPAMPVLETPERHFRKGKGATPGSVNPQDLIAAPTTSELGNTTAQDAHNLLNSVFENTPFDSDDFSFMAAAEGSGAGTSEDIAKYGQAFGTLNQAYPSLNKALMNSTADFSTLVDPVSS